MREHVLALGTDRWYERGLPRLRRIEAASVVKHATIRHTSPDALGAWLERDGGRYDRIWLVAETRHQSRRHPLMGHYDMGLLARTVIPHLGPDADLCVVGHPPIRSRAWPLAALMGALRPDVTVWCSWHPQKPWWRMANLSAGGPNPAVLDVGSPAALARWCPAAAESSATPAPGAAPRRPSDSG